MHFVGNNVLLFTTDFGTEPYLISIHDNVVCAAGVRFITHDVSCFNMSRLSKMEGSFDKVGSIELFENCFVGAYFILMPNCSVGRNSVVAAGSVVTKRIPDNEVWGGNPAKFIMTTDDYCQKLGEKNNQYPWITDSRINCSGEELRKKRESYFFGDKE